MRAWPLFVGMPLILAVALAAVFLAGRGAEDGGTVGPSSGGSDDSGGAAVDLGTPALGREDAPVVLTEYSDYQ